jgi:hypothetical protein
VRALNSKVADMVAYTVKGKKKGQERKGQKLSPIDINLNMLQ